MARGLGNYPYFCRANNTDMDRQTLTRLIFEKETYLCVGLDTDPDRIPGHLRDASSDPVFHFNKAIIDATQDLCVAYKINTAFYERMGLQGWESLKRTVDYIPETHFKIADAKRGDIGNTSHQYARAFFETWSFDAVTVAPYMGKDSVAPFLEYPGKWTIMLGLTSNEGSHDFQLQPSGEQGPLYARVIRQAMQWGSPDNLMFVVGATREAQIAEIRAMAPEYFFLVPGIGAQGGDLQAVSDQGLHSGGGLLVNASRAILYAGQGEDFAKQARTKALAYREAMRDCLTRYRMNH
jgi:orotidine-5'-phosphate decarboxylase